MPTSREIPPYPTGPLIKAASLFSLSLYTLYTPQTYTHIYLSRRSNYDTVGACASLRVSRRERKKGARAQWARVSHVTFPTRAPSHAKVHRLNRRTEVARRRRGRCCLLRIVKRLRASRSLRFCAQEGIFFQRWCVYVCGMGDLWVGGVEMMEEVEYRKWNEKLFCRIQWVRWVFMIISEIARNVGPLFSVVAKSTKWLLL